MTAGPETGSPAPPAALSAFLRGVERRGDVLARLQCGDVALAERALAAALRAFRSHADAAPMAAWPSQFWSLLAAAPAMREAAAAAHWEPALRPLAQMSPGDRLALLLRIVAGLDESAAAGVLELSEPQYQQALARACPRDPDGRPDAQAWRALAEAAQQQLRELGPGRLARLAQLREAALGGAAVGGPAAEALPGRAPPVARRTASMAGAPAWRRAWPWALALVLGAALVAAWAWRSRAPELPPAPASLAPAGVLHVADNAPVLVEELPAEDLPETTGMPGTDPADAAMLADPQLAIARQADFYAWFAAGGPIPPDESDPQPARARMAAASQEGPGLETADDP